MFAIRPLPFDPAAFDGAAGLVLTSANAVAAVAGLRGLPAWCVGPGTAAAARAAGFQARESGGDAVALLADLRRERPGGRLVHAHGRHLARDIAADLTAEGFDITGVAVYDAAPLDWPAGVLTALRGRRVVAPLFSPRAAAEFAARLGDAVPPGLRIVAISARCAERLGAGLRDRARIAARPDADAMRAALADELSHPGPQP